MAKNTELYFTGIIKQTGTKITDTEGVGEVIVYDSGNEGCNIYGIWVSNTTTTEVSATISISDGIASYTISSLSIPAEAIGTDWLLPMVGLPLRIDHHGNRFLRLAPMLYLVVSLDSALPAGGELSVFVDGELF